MFFPKNNKKTYSELTRTRLHSHNLMQTNCFPTGLKKAFQINSMRFKETKKND